MKRFLYLLIILTIIFACKQEKTIVINQLDSGYNIKQLITIEDIPINSSIWGNINVNENFIGIIKYDYNDEIIGYSIFNTETNEIVELSVNNPPEIENDEFGWLYIDTSQYNVYYKLIVNNENQMNNIKYYVETDGKFDLLYEINQSAILIDSYSQVYVYEKNDKAYLIYFDASELVLNEIKVGGYEELERFQIKLNDYVLTNYYYDDVLIMNYTSEEKNLLKIGEEEYELELYSKYLIFDEIIIVSNYSEYDGGNKQNLLNTYAINRETKEIYTLDLLIDTRNWIKCDDFYYAYDVKGNLIFLRYNESIDVITTSINKNSVDEQKTVPVNNKGIVILDQDYENETYKLSLLTLQ